MRLPDFALPGSDGKTHRRASFAGTTWVLYCYPKDGTGGCTTEAGAFRDAHRRFTALSVPVVGVSPDPVERHQRFQAKEHLPFLLLSDVEHTLLEALGVWTTKVLYGRKFLGVVRSTFLIGPDATILQEWRKVRVAGHVDAVLEAARTAARTGER